MVVGTLDLGINFKALVLAIAISVPLSPFHHLLPTLLFGISIKSLMNNTVQVTCLYL